MYLSNDLANSLFTNILLAQMKSLHYYCYYFMIQRYEESQSFALENMKEAKALLLKSIMRVLIQNIIWNHLHVLKQYSEHVWKNVVGNTIIPTRTSRDSIIHTLSQGTRTEWPILMSKYFSHPLCNILIITVKHSVCQSCWFTKGNSLAIEFSIATLGIKY